MTDRIQKCTEYLYNIPKFTKKNPLDHTRRLMHMLGNPQEDFKVIHVAGSNGKGSVCSFLYHMLLEQKKTVGLFTSPHLVDIRERFICNGEMCSEEEFLKAFDTVGKAAEHMQENGDSYPTFFEYIFAMGMLIFKSRGVEYAVLETGMGGRLDATNIVRHPLLCVITSISLEHTEYLGDTIEQIAGEKAGIIKTGTPLVFDGSNPAAAGVIREKAQECQVRYYEILKNMCFLHETTSRGIDFLLTNQYHEKTEWFIPFHGEYQVMNAALAITAFQVLAADKGFKEDREVIARGLAHTRWPGRMQEVFPEVYFDGAHNPDGIRHFLRSVQMLCQNDDRAPLLLFSMVKDKDYHRSVQMLAQQKWDAVTVTKIPDERGLSCEKLREEFAGHNGVAVTAREDYDAAFADMLKQKKPGQKLFCTGSLYFIGALLAEVGKQKPDLSIRQ